MCFKKKHTLPGNQTPGTSHPETKKIQIIFDCCVIFFYFRPKSRPFLEKADFLRKKKTLFALFFQKGLLSRPRSTKEDPVGITADSASPAGVGATFVPPSITSHHKVGVAQASMPLVNKFQWPVSRGR